MKCHTRSRFVNTLFLKLIATILLTIGTCFCGAQTLSQKQLAESLASLSGKKDTNHINLLISLAQHYIFKPGEEKKDLDSAVMFLQEAEQLSKKLSFKKGIGNCILLYGKNFQERGNREKGKEYFLRAIDYSAKCKDYNTNGNAWWQLSYYYDLGSPAEIDKRVACWRNAYAAFELAANKEYMAFALENLGDLHHITGKIDSAIIELRQAIQLYQSVSHAQLQGTFDLLGNCYLLIGDYEPALKYELEAVRIIEKLKDTTQAMMTIYYRTALAYEMLENYTEAFKYYLKASAISERFNSLSDLYILTSTVVQILIVQKKPEQALMYLQHQEKLHPIDDGRVKQRFVNTAYVDIYLAMNRKSDAKKYIDLIMNQKVPISLDEYKVLSKYLLAVGQLERADSIINAYEKAALVRNTRAALPEITYKRFLLDSLKGNYLMAIQHYQAYKKVNDSLNNYKKARLIQALQIEYETDKKNQQIKLQGQDLSLKEKDLLLNRQNLLLVTRQSEFQKKDFEQNQAKFLYESQVKEKNLQLANSEAEKKNKDLLIQKKDNDLLKQEGIANQSNLRKANAIKNLTLAGIALSVIVTLLLFYLYHSKKKSNAEVSSKNKLLENLVKEKEWLVKEIHHRVKNNLQTIVSLLESQTTYLTSQDALLAIKDSQNRVYTMSLLHQKLYQTDNLTSINMEGYVSELLNYFKETYDIKQRIKFCSEVSPFHLDVSQAIPIGLIINEAVTNSIKHAFPSLNNNIINVQMKQDTVGMTFLTISDNGIGFDGQYPDNYQQSLGLRLINGLSEDIKADLKIESKAGTKISLKFIATILSPSENTKVLAKEIYA